MNYNYGEIARWSVVASSILFAVVLVYGFRRLGAPAIANAQAAKNAEIATAEQRLAEMRSRVEQLRGHLSAADADAASIRERGAQQACREREATLAEANAAGERTLRNAQGELERAREAARDELRAELLEKALHAARQTATTRVTADVNAQLLDGFVRAIEHGALN